MTAQLARSIGVPLLLANWFAPGEFLDISLLFEAPMDTAIAPFTSAFRFYLDDVEVFPAPEITLWFPGHMLYLLQIPGPQPRPTTCRVDFPNYNIKLRTKNRHLVDPWLALQANVIDY